MSNDKDVSSNDTPNDDTIHNEHLGVILKMMPEYFGYLPNQSKYLSELATIHINVGSCLNLEGG